MPLVSVVMPVFNGEKYVFHAVESILHQTFKDLEYIIVDDGSTDGTSEILSSIKDKRVKIITFQSNRGIVDALNEGISYASGKYIARQDADDISLPRRLEKQIRCIESDSGLVLVATGIKIIADEITDALRSIEAFYCSYGTKQEVRQQFRSLNSPIAHPTVLFRKSAFVEAGGYRKEFEFCEDTDLWYRMLEHGEMSKICEPLVYYRRHADAICYAHHAEQQGKYAKLIARVREEIVQGKL